MVVCKCHCFPIESKNPMPSGVEVRQSGISSQGLFATKKFNKNKKIFCFVGVLATDEETSPYALQVDENLFLESTCGFDDFLNHSCDPNCYVDFKKLHLIAKREINIGDELTINYNTSEYDLVGGKEDCSFTCKCGAANCLGTVKGFKHMSPCDQKSLKDFLSPFLLKKSGISTSRP